MEFRLNDNERMFVDSVGHVVKHYMEPPRSGAVNAAVYSSYSQDFYASLSEAGFLGAAREHEFGPVCAVMMIEEAARSPLAVEVGTSALVAALAAEGPLEGPVAITAAADLARPIRFLDVARTLLVLSGDDLLALDLAGIEITSNGGMFAYPFGTFRSSPDLSAARRVGSAAAARLWWQVALASEGAALMQSALDFTVEYVKNRRQFGRPIGAFQAVKHRLAASAQKARAALWLARRAAWSGDGADAAMAALYVQGTIQDVVYDCHQFNGAMGMTLECPLHFWTYRLKALQGELGGARAQALSLAGSRWL